VTYEITDTKNKTLIEFNNNMKASIKKADKYDFLVLGSGEAGKYIAWSQAKLGKRVAVIERKYIGGSCPNIACLPSKNIIYSAKVASLFFRSREFGITKDNCRIDMTVVRDRKRKMVDGLVEMHLANFKASGAQLLTGSGRFTAPKTIEITTPEGDKRLVYGDKIIVSTGSQASIEPVPGLVESNPLTHVEALELDRIPEHILIFSGGYVGLEFAQALRRFGSRVTVITRNERLLMSEDKDVSECLHSFFHDEGIDILLKTSVSKVEGKSGQLVKLLVTQAGKERMISGSHLLAATGRVPNTKDIGLDLAGIETTERGHIKVNERLETTAPDVWAVGDCAGSPYFTHIAFDDYRIVRDNLAGGQRVTTGRQVPFCLFTDPQLARIGLSETEANERGIAYRLSKIPMAAALRTRTISETRGFLKALVDAKSDRILGFTAFGVEAGEIMATVQVAMIAGLPYAALRDAILAHPTLAEGIITLFTNVPPKTKTVAI
jgi:pyruvate/2-oxoglutarate dehydrogenase complex dihydrolipoamide dehydrogenase (E3) component